MMLAIVSTQSDKSSDIITISRNAPFLSPEQEKRLLKDKSKVAKEQLLVSYLRLVVAIAYKIAWTSFIIPDLISEGTIGLIKAIENFNPLLGDRLGPFATYYIKGEMYNFIIQNCSIIKLPMGNKEKKIFFNISKISNMLRHTECDSDELFNKKVSEIDNFAKGNIVHIDSGSHYLVDPRNPEQMIVMSDADSYLKKKLVYAISTLNPREQEIITTRYLNEKKLTLATLAIKYGISKERIRQIQQNAVNKIRSFFWRNGRELNPRLPRDRRVF